MRALLPAAALFFACMTGLACAFDLQGHRGARGLAPENTIDGFRTALATGVTTLELDLAMTKDGVLVVSHDSRLNPDHTRGPDGTFLLAPGPAIRELTLSELTAYDVGRLKPGTDYAKRFSSQHGVDGARIPALTQVFDLVRGDDAKDIRFNIETKLTPTSGADTPDPHTFAQAIADVVRAEKLEQRVSVQSFDWRTLAAIKRIAPEIARVCLTVEADWEDNLARGKPGPSPWTAGLDIDDVDGSVPKLVAAAGCAVWSPYYRNVSEAAIAEAKAAGVTVIPWTVNEPADMERLIGLGVDGIITDYPDRLRAVMAARGMTLPKPVTLK
jgi:glycerophosphoryl diester phosphodiesterase